MPDEFSILARWLVAVLAVMGMCGLFACWMLFRMWWRRHYRQQSRSPQQFADPSLSSDLWQLSGQRLMTKIDDVSDPPSGTEPNDPSDFNDDDQPFDDPPPWR